ncbi:DUF3039 domain-containing protein [Nocardioides sp. ChNu-153]|uniref:DUF3039 domain-containing protein n=1 Tax=unclassified Nocardioides TaxID=2615069 RepID=UPI002405D806|nr:MULTISPECIES: DUF3039 domain-containing protein [unclassified Nocardioides]MDF9716624.1 DUF3039 domain-containing protein [Nocardioides sp. ChNu-99]MDN7120557.1 DUF3039 domain-containing protein [Nocardioides sp. ChNu-153]
MLKEDLTSGWDSPVPQRRIAAGQHSELHPVSELPHPIIAKATESFGPDAAHDNYVGPVASAAQLRLLEIKQSQWRGGVWQDDETGVCWLVVAGLAKGGHQDRDDFYQRVQRENDSGDISDWLPSKDDIRLLKQETAARLMTEWELGVQRLVRDVLRTIHEGGAAQLAVEHPIPGKGGLAQVEISVIAVRDDDYVADEVVVEIVPAAGFAWSNLMWQLTARVLNSIDPPEQRWDRYKDTYSNIGEVGAWTERLTALDEHVRSGTLATSAPGSVSHFSHRKHLAGSTIEGTAVRALCGTFFVPTQDHKALPECPTCSQRFAELPG